MNDFTLHRTYAAAPEKVWAHVTEPDLLARWFCPNPSLDVHCTADLRPGGAWRCTMGRYAVGGTYAEVTPPSRLVFTWAWDHEDAPVTTVVVTLTRDAAGTRLTLDHSESTADAGDDGHRGGWEITLDRLAAQL